MLKLTSI